MDANYSAGVITTVVSFYWVVSLSLVFLNKYIFRYGTHPANRPMSIAHIQFIVQWSMQLGL